MDALKTMHRARGFSLVELMIALTIGIVLTFAIGTFYAGNKQTFRQQDDLSRLQETGRTAIDILGYHIRAAGYVDVTEGCGTAAVCGRIQTMVSYANKAWEDKQDTAAGRKDTLGRFFSAALPGVQAVMGCDKNFNAGLTPAWSCGTSGNDNSITVAYQAQSATFGWNAATGQGGDCAGQSTTASSASPSGQIAINRFFRDATTNRLMCTGNGNPTVSQPIAEGVQELVFLYGIPATATGGATPLDANVVRYVPASSISGDAWTRVLSVRVCVLIFSPNSVAPGSTNYTNCSGTTSTSTDGRIRQAYRATFALRNNVLTNPDVL